MWILKPTILDDKDVENIKKAKEKFDFVPIVYVLLGGIISGLLGAAFGYVFLYPH